MPEDKILIVPLPKSPRPLKGRFGPEKWQDWFRSLRCAVWLSEKCCASIAIVSGFESEKYVEAYFYTNYLLDNFWIKKNQIIIIQEGQETISQLNEVFKLSETEKYDEVIIISSFLHFPRVCWLCFWGKISGNYNTKYKNKFVFGIPRPREAITDIILDFLFPVIDLLELREAFLRKIQGRRKEGKI